MKKKLMIFVLAFTTLLIGCNADVNEENVMKDIAIVEMIQYDIDWNHIEFPIDLTNLEIFKKNCTIETDESAVKFATTMIDELHNSSKFLDYESVSIVHSLEDNIWVFEYSLDQKDKRSEDLIDSGGLYVAMDGNEGVLLKAWLEE